MKQSYHLFRVILAVVVVVGLWLTAASTPAWSQQSENQANLIVNGGFEGGFQSGVGVGDGWGAFSNGNAAVGWNGDSWGPVVIAGKQAQFIEIRNATDRDRYAGIYQTVTVVPGQPYKLTIKGLIRSEEGDVQKSDYGYRLQYGLDETGGTAWELVNEKNWHEIQWDEQPLNDPLNGTYRFDTFETIITPKSDKLTLFIRAWKKWVNNGAGLYDLDEISLVGPAPADSQAAGQVAAVGSTNQPTGSELVSAGPSAQSSDQAANQVPAQAVPQATSVPQPRAGELPVSGADKEGTINFIEIIAIVLVLVLLTGAVTTTVRRQRAAE